MSDLLQRIVAATLETVTARQAARPLTGVERDAAACTPRPDAFRRALARPASVNVIAECKRRSPLKGVLREVYDPRALARQYEDAGAAAISVLTEPAFFDGSLAHLRAVRDAVQLPVLRKDFIVDPYQLAEARAMGADAVLLIVAVLGERLGALLEEAEGHGLATIVEVHDEDELQHALDAGATVLGVNSRDLRTMTVKPETFAELGPRIPSSVTAVAESGIRSAADIARLRERGYSAFLVGERLVRSEDPGLGLRELMEAPAGT